MSDEYHGDPDPEEVIEALQGIADVLRDAYADYEPPAIQFDVAHGIYQNARLEADDAVFTLTNAYYWATDYHDRHLIDIYADEIPGTVSLEGCQLHIDSEDGVPLLGGPIIDVGQRDGEGGATTVVVGGQHDA